MTETAFTGSTTPGFEWTGQFESGHAEIDATHREFVALVDALLRCDEASVSAALDRLARHAASHFGEEDELMRSTGYTAAGCHMDEHVAVLSSIEEVRALAAQGDFRAARPLARALADWFPEHAEAMDHGLARWLLQQRLGGQPVTIRRARQASGQ